MRIIAHRANIGGSNFEVENKLFSIKTCIDKGFDVEIDIRYKNGELYLGHDCAKDVIPKKELDSIKGNSWIHCKNLEAISFFNEIDEGFNYFWHQEDSYTLTSKGFIWTYPGKELTKKCICVMPELNYAIDKLKILNNLEISGVCSDYPDMFL